MEFDVDLPVGSEGISNAIETGIQIEQAGEKFYREKAAQVSIPYVRQYLERIADEEVKHQQFLAELKSSLMDKGRWTEVKGMPNTKKRLKELEIFSMKKGLRIEENSDTIEALNEALKLEERSKAFYLKLAAEVKNDRGRKFFQKLADWEESHKELISGMREVLLGVAGTWG